jgi:SAM-dependent methyltransferase
VASVSISADIKAEYLLDNSWVHARHRLALLEDWADPTTTRHLAGLGVTEGWHCLEVGGGGGSIAAWLCRRVGVKGSVTATDINPLFLGALDFPNLEVRRHNILEDDLELGAFDLIHVRAVLMHLRERGRALDSLVSALKPGGWLLVEEGDGATFVADPRAGEEACHRFLRVAAALNATGAGLDLSYRRRLYADVCAHGPTEVRGEGRSSMARGASPLAEFWRITYTGAGTHAKQWTG